MAETWSIFPYNPNKPAPIAFAILIALLGIYQFYLSFFIYKWKRFGAVMTWASTIWLTGFITRSISVHNPQNIPLFITQYVLILMGPPLFSASEYFILGRLLSYLPYHSPIHPGRVFSTFVFLSTIIETLTGSGAGNSAGPGRSQRQREIGGNLVKAALILQCFVEVGFLSLVGIVEWRCRKRGNFPRNGRVVCVVLYVTSLMILVRCIVRTIEGFEAASCDPEREDPYCGPISRNEWFLWVFEVANIMLFVGLLVGFHPGRFLPRSRKVFLDFGDGETERVGPGFVMGDRRGWVRSFVDPFNVWGILTGKGMLVEEFWKREWPKYGANGGEGDGDVATVEQVMAGVNAV